MKCLSLICRSLWLCTTTSHSTFAFQVLRLLDLRPESSADQNHPVSQQLRPSTQPTVHHQPHATHVPCTAELPTPSTSATLPGGRTRAASSSVRGALAHSAANMGGGYGRRWRREGAVGEVEVCEDGCGGVGEGEGGGGSRGRCRWRPGKGVWFSRGNRG